MPDLPENHPRDKNGRHVYVPAHPDGYGPKAPDPAEYARDPVAFLRKHKFPGYEPQASEAVTADAPAKPKRRVKPAKRAVAVAPHPEPPPEPQPEPEPALPGFRLHPEEGE